MIEQNIEDVITVDSTKPLRYPAKTNKVSDRSPELVGPKSFHPADLEPWLHPSQRTGSLSGIVLREHLRESGMLQRCLSLREIQAIHARGIDFFHKYFAGLVLSGFRTLVRVDYEPIIFRGSDLCVPCLCEQPFEIVWCWIGND
ncbi:MAG TPA: hypothetical protein VIR98_01770 [Candidatus Paceibacterota bacterium]|jgi:hypothetical protein